VVALSPMQAAGLVKCFVANLTSVIECFECVLAAQGLGAEYCAALNYTNPYLPNAVVALSTVKYPSQVRLVQMSWQAGRNVLSRVRG